MLKHFIRTAAISLVLAAAPTARAHVVFANAEATPNSYFASSLRVSHGCGDSPTRSVRVEIPDGVNIARPQPKPGWRLRIEREPLATPIRSEGGHEITERVTAIIWSGNLPADQFEQFGLMMRLPDHAGALYFPVIQTCAEGEQRWDQVATDGAAWGSVPRPAPILTLMAPQSALNAHTH